MKLTLSPESGYDKRVTEPTPDRPGNEELIREKARATRPRGKAVIATDTAGRILYWNEGAERLYGWKREEVLNRNVVDVTTATLSRPAAAQVMRILRNGESWSGTFQLQDRDGRRFLADVTDNPVFNAEGELIGIIGISRRAKPPQSTR